MGLRPEEPGIRVVEIPQSVVGVPLTAPFSCGGFCNMIVTAQPAGRVLLPPSRQEYVHRIFSTSACQLGGADMLGDLGQNMKG